MEPSLDNLIDSLFNSDVLPEETNITFSCKEKIDQIEEKLDLLMCNSCGSPIEIIDHILSCSKCGLEISNVSSSTDDYYTSNDYNNTNDKGFMSMKIVGKGSERLQKNLLKTSANYRTYRSMLTLKELYNWNSQCESGKRLPKNVLQEANDMFTKIKDHGRVYRKNIKNGVLSACIYYACYRNGISRTSTEIAQFAKILEKFHSHGDRILKDLNERKIIELPDHINPIKDYVERYMQILNIPSKYMQFVLDIIECATEAKLHVLFDSKNNTKCVGAIYLLIDRAPELKYINKDLIDTKCSISKTTYIKYYNMICKYHRVFAHIFILHQIPMKAEWRENTAMILSGEINANPPKLRKRAVVKRQYQRKKPLNPNEILMNRMTNLDKRISDIFISKK